MDALYLMESAGSKEKNFGASRNRRILSGTYNAQMGFPLDVWSAKIFNVLFFGEEPEKPREAIPFLKKVAQEKWGDWRGYAFVYILNDLAKLSDRVGFDLTKF